MPDNDDSGLRVHLLDEALIVVDKPAGLPSVPVRAPQPDDASLAERVQARWPDALVVHRLDMATSGLVAFARGKAAQRSLSAAFAARSVDKRYVAVVAGCMPARHGADASTVDGWQEIALPLAADWPNRPRQQVDLAAGKPSLTRWRIDGRQERPPIEHGTACDAAATTRLALWPVTGRTHQLRVHLLAIGHPIVGDALYGDAIAPGSLHRPSRLLLHATRLDLPHPADGRRIVVESEAPF